MGLVPRDRGLCQGWSIPAPHNEDPLHLFSVFLTHSNSHTQEEWESKMWKTFSKVHNRDPQNVIHPLLEETVEESVLTSNMEGILETHWFLRNILEIVPRHYFSIQTHANNP